jgi:hypothetical protein
LATYTGLVNPPAEACKTGHPAPVANRRADVILPYNLRRASLYFASFKGGKIQRNPRPTPSAILKDELVDW